MKPLLKVQSCRLARSGVSVCAPVELLFSRPRACLVLFPPYPPTMKTWANGSQTSREKSLAAGFFGDWVSQTFGFDQLCRTQNSGDPHGCKTSAYQVALQFPHFGSFLPHFAYKFPHFHFLSFTKLPLYLYLLMIFRRRRREKAARTRKLATNRPTRVNPQFQCFFPHTDFSQCGKFWKSQKTCGNLTCFETKVWKVFLYKSMTYVISVGKFHPQFEMRVPPWNRCSQ